MYVGQGYEGYSKSVNALEAEDEGRFPISVIGKKLKIETDTIREYFTSDEWHHVGKDYVKVDYYDLEEIKSGLTDEVLKFDKELKKQKYLERKEPSVIQKGCSVNWLDWVGIGRNKKCIEKHQKNCNVSIKNKTATISFKNDAGNKESFTKRLDTNGFSFITGEELKEARRLEKERAKELRDKKSLLNKNLKDLFTGDSKVEIIVADYFKSFERKDGVLKQNEIATFSKMTKKDFLMELNTSGMRYAERAISDCLKNGFSRLNLEHFVIVSSDTSSIKEKLLSDCLDSKLKVVKSENYQEHFSKEMSEMLIEIKNKDDKKCVKKVEVKKPNRRRNRP